MMELMLLLASFTSLVVARPLAACRKAAARPESVYSYTRMFHTSGITLALCDNTRDTAIELIRRFKDAGAMISFDCNYRANLWGEEKARQTIYSILPYVDILFVSEETSRRMMQRKEDSLMEIYGSTAYPSLV